MSRLAEFEGSSVEWFLGDGLGSTRQFVDGDGVVVLAQRYDPYGLLLAQYGTGRSGYGFTGEQVDPTGLVYLRARYLHPALGRFLSVDPFPGYAALPATIHPYLYCLDDPVNCTDPSGELPPWLEFAAGLGYQYSNDILWGLPDIVLFPPSYQLPPALIETMPQVLLLNCALEYVGQLALPSHVSVGIVNSIESIAEAQTLIAKVQAGIQECSPAFQRGRQLGRAISSAQAALEIIGGVAAMLGGLIGGPPLVLAAGAAGGPAFALTGGAAAATAVAVIEAGGAATVHGVGVLAHNLGNPVPNVSYAKRSSHAEQRGREGRSVGTAFGDAQRATRSKIYVQPENSRYVVRGGGGREHVFEPNGELVTTVMGRSENAHLRLVENGTRRPVTQEEFDAFKQLFK